MVITFSYFSSLFLISPPFLSFSFLPPSPHQCHLLCPIAQLSKYSCPKPPPTHLSHVLHLSISHTISSFSASPFLPSLLDMAVVVVVVFDFDFDFDFFFSVGLVVVVVVLWLWWWFGVWFCLWVWL